MATTTKYQRGIGLLLIVALIWVVSSFVVQDILSDHGFGRAFFLTFFANSLFFINIPLIYAMKVLRPYFLPEKTNDTYTQVSEEGEDPTEGKGTAFPCAANTTPSNESASTFKQLWHRPTFFAALRVAPLWFIANFLYNYSLSLTSVSSNTVLSAASGLFTFALAVYLGQDKFSYWKVSGVITSILGVTLTAISDSRHSTFSSSPSPSPSPLLSSSNPALLIAYPSSGPKSIGPSPMQSSPSPTPPSMGGHESILGDIICLVSAVFYACYTTTIAIYLPSERKEIVMLFFGYIGLLGLIVLSPFILTFELLGVTALYKIAPTAFLLIAAKGLFDNVLSDALWAIALKWTSPTVASVGLSLTIPMSILAEILLRQMWPPLLAWVGAILMVFGFVACSLGQ